MTELAEVHLIGLPLAERALAAQHFDELVREFSMLDAADGSGHGVPTRLIQLRDELQARYQSFVESAQATIEEAASRGDDTVDVTYRLPVDVVDAAARLGALLDEADEYCRAGEHLLTLATPDACVRYRRWFLGEFVRQAGGEPARPWSEYR